MKLILSIGKDEKQKGIISLWDSIDALPEDEYTVLLELTEYQEKLLTFKGIKPKNILV
jgi:hypothetical protein